MKGYTETLSYVKLMYMYVQVSLLMKPKCPFASVPIQNIFVQIAKKNNGTITYKAPPSLCLNPNTALLENIFVQTIQYICYIIKYATNMRYIDHGRLLLNGTLALFVNFEALPV